MELLCILISFTLVNVLVADLDDYGLMVLKTNEHFKLAKNCLPKIITEMVHVSNKNKAYSCKQMAYMLVVPENVEEYDEQSLNYQILMERKLECSSKIAAPDIDKARVFLVSEKEWNSYLKFLFSKIRFTYFNNENYNNITLIKLGNERRKISGEAIITLIRSVLDGKNEDFEDFLKLCRLLGLFRSLENPNAFVIEASIKNDTCILKRNLSAGTIRYKRDQTKIWEVKNNGAFIAYLSKQIKILKWDLSEKDYYRLEVLKTNEHFKLAKNFLPEIITEMVHISNKNLAYSCEEMAYMLVVPDNKAVNGDHGRFYQILMERKLEHSSKIAAPDIYKAKNYNNITLLKLGNERRKISGEAIITLIRSILDGKNEDFADFLKLCRLLGLFRSLEDPNAFVIEASIKNDTCILERNLSAETSKYKRDGKNIWEVDDKGVHRVNLSEQIVIWEQEFLKKLNL